MIYKHQKLKLPLYIGLSSVYIILKYSVTPFLYLLRKFGFNSTVPKEIDSLVNRAILPLTENPDTNEHLEVGIRIKKGDSLPPLPIIFSDGSKSILNTYTNKNLLLIFLRGSWCSYSRLHLSDLFFEKDKFEKSGIQLLGVTSYKDQNWWYSNGIEIPMIVDPYGELFDWFGIKINSWIEFSWGRVLPHEGVLFFDQNGKYISGDVRKVNSIIPGQKFLSAQKWLQISNKNT